MRSLVREGQKLGADVFIFSNRDVSIQNKMIRGYVPSETGWQTRRFGWPDVVIDRCRKGLEGYREFRRRKLFVYANSPYTNKLNATKLFANEEKTKKWIPESVVYSPKQLAEMIKKHKILYIKPGNGTGGRSIVKVRRTETGYDLLGTTRSHGRREVHFKTLSGLTAWLNRWANVEKIRNGVFMIQQGLNLELTPGCVADMRLLIQKNEVGKWDVTGEGMRIGRKNSPVSNLHGGGHAAPAKSFLTERFGQAKTKEIMQECYRLAHQVVGVIEKNFGKMMEMGLDIGIDVNGDVWLIEVNPKPGRELFKQMGKPKLYRKTIQRPLLYALYLRKNRSKGAKNKAFDMENMLYDESDFDYEEPEEADPDENEEEEQG